MRALLVWLVMTVLATLLLAQTSEADPYDLGAGRASGIVPVEHHDYDHDDADSHGRGLRARVWTERGGDAVYRPGDDVLVRFRVSEDAYVCVYNIDTEGRLNILYPTYADDDGYSEGGYVHTLPPAYADIDYVIEGPAGIEYLAIVASRRPLCLPWGDPAAVRDYLESDPYGDDDQRHWDYEAGVDDYSVELAWTDEGYWIEGDPFVAMRHVNAWLAPSRHQRNVSSGYARIHVGSRYSYPRYACYDCHGRTASYDPYRDHCSVFSVQVNARWHYRPWRVDVVHYQPRYVYVRHHRVPGPYRAIPYRWPAHRRRVLHDRFRTHLTTAVRPKSGHQVEKRHTKSTAGYAWKSRDLRSRPGSARFGKSSADPVRKGDARKYRGEDRTRKQTRSGKAPRHVVKGSPERSQHRQVESQKSKRAHGSTRSAVKGSRSDPAPEKVTRAKRSVKGSTKGSVKKKRGGEKADPGKARGKKKAAGKAR